MPIALRVGTSEAYLEIEQEAQALGNAAHRRHGELAASRAEALLGNGADLIAEHIARAPQPSFGGPHFHVKGNPSSCSRQGKHHHKARGASVEAIGRDDHRRANEVLLMAARWAEVDRPDFTAQRSASQLSLRQAVGERILPSLEVAILLSFGASIRGVGGFENLGASVPLDRVVEDIWDRPALVLSHLPQKRVRPRLDSDRACLHRAPTS